MQDTRVQENEIIVHSEAKPLFGCSISTLYTLKWEIKHTFIHFMVSTYRLVDAISPFESAAPVSPNFHPLASLEAIPGAKGGI